MDNNKKFTCNIKTYEKIVDSISLVTNTLKTTFGLYHHKLDVPHNNISNGYIVASSIVLKDRLGTMGINILLQNSESINRKFKDGVTLSFILTQSILEQILKNHSNVHPQYIICSLDIALQKIIENLNSQRIFAKTEEEIFQIACSNANGDENVGEAITRSMKQCSKGCVYIHPQSHSSGVNINVQKGMIIKFKKIYKIDQPIFYSPLVLVADQFIHTLHTMTTILHQVAKQSKPLIIICRGISAEAINDLEINCKANILEAVCIVTDEDLTSVGSASGSMVLSEISNQHGIEVLGSLKMAYFSMDCCALVKSNDKCKENVVSIQIGDKNPIKAKMLIAKYKRSLEKTISAVKHGVLPGGGSSLFFASNIASKNIPKLGKLGFEILQESIRKPIKTLITNSSVRGTVKLLNQLKKKGSPYGFNINSGTLDHMINAGIIDNYDIIEAALNSSLSTIRQILLSYILIKKH